MIDSASIEIFRVEAEDLKKSKITVAQKMQLVNFNEI